MKAITFFVSLLFVCSNTIFGQTGTTSTVTQSNGSDSPKKTSDNDFIHKAAMGGMMEVELGKAARIQATNQRVKNYGEMMDHDHTLANDQLKTIAENKNVKIPDRLSSEKQKHVDMMKARKGNDFDKSYMDMMVNDHKKDIKEFEEASEKATDPDLKAFASKTLPVLKMHLDSAKAIQKSLK
jgi:putative membrane protein